MRQRVARAAVAGFCVSASLVLWPARPACADNMFAFYAGKSFTQDTSLTLRQPAQNTNLTFHGVSYNDSSFKDPIYYGLRATHYFKARPYLGVALDFFHYKVYAQTDKEVHATGTENGEPVDRDQLLGDTIQHFSISHGVNFLSLNAVGRLQWLRTKHIPHGRFQPYAGVGGGVLIMHPESQIQGRFFEHYEWNGFGTQAFVGANILFTRWLGLMTEYKFTHHDADVTVVGGSAQTSLNTHHLVFGTFVKL